MPKSCQLCTKYVPVHLVSYYLPDDLDPSLALNVIDHVTLSTPSPQDFDQLVQLGLFLVLGELGIPVDPDGQGLPVELFDVTGRDDLAARPDLARIANPCQLSLYHIAPIG